MLLILNRIENTIVERLKEQDLNAIDLLQECVEVEKRRKQKELSEGIAEIFSIQRTPERRVFYIDTGHLPSHRAMAYLERIKNEIRQRW